MLVVGGGVIDEAEPSLRSIIGTALAAKAARSGSSAEGDMTAVVVCKNKIEVSMRIDSTLIRARYGVFSRFIYLVQWNQQCDPGVDLKLGTVLQGHPHYIGAQSPDAVLGFAVGMHATID